MQSFSKRGFTLLELSIVIVVVALIAGGTVLGASLVRSSQLRAVVTESQKIIGDANTFRDTYNALPGDFAAASTVWSGAANGDGNGRVSIPTPYIYEAYNFWRHMYRAGIITQSYTGTAGSSDSGAVDGENVMASKLASAGWNFFYVNNSNPDYYYETSFSTSPANHFLLLSHNFIGTVITSEEGRSIDMKIDDGDASAGKVGTQGSGVVWNNTETERNRVLLINTDM